MHIYRYLKRNIPVDSRVHKMEIESENIAKKLRQSMYVWLLQLPPRVRNLPLAEFVEKYQGDLNKYVSSRNIISSQARN